MKYVWILFGNDGNESWVEAVFDDKVQAEADLRRLNANPQRDAYLYTIQEKTITPKETA